MKLGVGDYAIIFVNASYTPVIITIGPWNVPYVLPEGEQKKNSNFIWTPYICHIKFEALFELESFSLFSIIVNLLRTDHRKVKFCCLQSYTVVYEKMTHFQKMIFLKFSKFWKKYKIFLENSFENLHAKTWCAKEWQIFEILSKNKICHFLAHEWTWIEQLSPASLQINK